MDSIFWRVPKLKQLECMRVTGSRHSFPRHFHETYVVEVVEKGRNEFWCEGKVCAAKPDDIIVIHPGDIHTGYPAGSDSLSYRAFYPSKTLMAAIHSQVRGLPFPPRFRSYVIQDRQLAQMFKQAHTWMELDAGNVTAHRLFLLALGELSMRYSMRGICSIRDDDPRTIPTNRVQPALTFLADKYHENISLSELSSFCGLSEYHFLRTFKRSTGLAPYEYVIATRVEESRKLLSRGMSIAETAARTGFCDQSHLNRHFKRILGITPGKYARSHATPLESMQL